MTNVVDLESALALVAEQQSSGKKIVFTNGCFDLLHVGHVTYLEQARALGDFLVVGVNSDASVRANKGPLRPIIKEQDRARLLGALKPVDVVVIFSESTPLRLIQALKPNIHVKGGDYTLESLPETPLVRGYGGEVCILPFLEGYSSSNIIEAIELLRDSSF